MEVSACSLCGACIRREMILNHEMKLNSDMYQFSVESKQPKLISGSGTDQFV